MRKSLHEGKLLPESEDEFKSLLERHHPRLVTVCGECKAAFTGANTKSPEGWRDTQIIGWCEDCYAALLFPDGEHPVDEAQGAEHHLEDRHNG